MVKYRTVLTHTLLIVMLLQHAVVELAAAATCLLNVGYTVVRLKWRNSADNFINADCLKSPRKTNPRLLICMNDNNSPGKI